jgi:hypothetical protein
MRKPPKHQRGSLLRVLKKESLHVKGIQAPIGTKKKKVRKHIVSYVRVRDQRSLSCFDRSNLAPSHVKSSQVKSATVYSNTTWKIHFVTGVRKRKDKSVGNYLQN